MSRTAVFPVNFLGDALRSLMNAAGHFGIERLARHGMFNDGLCVGVHLQA